MIKKEKRNIEKKKKKEKSKEQNWKIEWMNERILKIWKVDRKIKLSSSGMFYKLWKLNKKKKETIENKNKKVI